MFIYYGTEDQKSPSTTHTALLISAGECKYFDMLTLRKHGRTDWSLLYCEEGILKVDETEIHSGQAWIYPPNVPQKYISLKSNNTVHHYLHFTGSDILVLIDALKIPLMSPIDTPKDSFLKVFKKIEKSTIRDDELSQIISEYHIIGLISILSKIAPHIGKKI